LSPISSSTGSTFDFNTRLGSYNATACLTTMALILFGYVCVWNYVAIRRFILRLFPKAESLFDEVEVSRTPDLSIALSDGILKGLPSYEVKDNDAYFSIVGDKACKSAGGFDQPIPKGWEGQVDVDDGKKKVKVREDALAVRIVHEEAGAFGEGVQKALRRNKGKSKEKKDSSGKDSKGTSKSGKGTGYGDLKDEPGSMFDDDGRGRRGRLSRRRSTVAPLAWGADQVRPIHTFFTRPSVLTFDRVPFQLTDEKNCMEWPSVRERGGGPRRRASRGAATGGGVRRGECAPARGRRVAVGRPEPERTRRRRRRRARRRSRGATAAAERGAARRAPLPPRGVMRGVRWHGIVIIR
jgi:hypothetical protein